MLYWSLPGGYHVKTRWPAAGRVFICFILVLATGCVAIPKQELGAYREAFLEARKAGDLLYDELTAAMARRSGMPAASPCRSVDGAMPQCFNPVAVLHASNPDDDPAILARRLALGMIASYNLAIADMVEGKTEADVKNRISELAKLADDFVALASISSSGVAAFVTGPALATFTELAARLERARTTVVARQSLLAEADAINELIDLLIVDTKPVYDLYAISQGSFALKQPTAEMRRREFARAVAFHDSLTAYVRLLGQTKTALATLRNALAQTGQSVADIRSIITEAIEIRKAAEAFWSAVRDLRS